MQIFLASDHAGYETKQEVVNWLCNVQDLEIGFNLTLYEKTLYHIDRKFDKFTIRDLGCSSEQTVDYPFYAHKLCTEMLFYSSAIGILICGTGIGMSMAANKFSHIRAALCKDVDTAIMTRKHNNANVLCLGARNTIAHNIIPIVKSFCVTRFEGGRHLKRISKFSL